MPKADVQETAERKFVERKSYVAKDGREVLYKLDWQRRVKQLRERCDGRCEYMIEHPSDTMPSIRCSREAAHPHHLVKRSKGRDDRLNNLAALCVEHHRQMHPEKQLRSGRRR